MALLTCKKIAHVQVMRIFADGRVIKPGSFNASWRYRDAVTLEDGWCVDHSAEMTSPDYQSGWPSPYGKKNGGSGPAIMGDAPDTYGGDKGFYHPSKNPPGWRSVTYQFETFAWCMGGPDCGRWYEGLTWMYVKTHEDEREGRRGTRTILDKNVATPTASFLQAFDKFNRVKGFTPCR
jgi:hypothetical protein